VESSQRGRDAQLQKFNQDVPRDDVRQAHPEDIDPACKEHAVKALMYGLTRRKLWSGMVKVKGL
jgi:hypothetical protein